MPICWLSKTLVVSIINHILPQCCFKSRVGIIYLLKTNIYLVQLPRFCEWVAISFSNVWKWKVKVKSLSPVWLSGPVDSSLPGSSRQEYWSGVPLFSLHLTLQQHLILDSVTVKIFGNHSHFIKFKKYFLPTTCEYTHTNTEMCTHGEFYCTSK